MNNLPLQDPLVNLRGIHLPTPIAAWPFAPGWYVLFIITVLLLAWSIIKMWKMWRQYRFVKVVMFELNLIKKEYFEKSDHCATAAKTSILLRRTALAIYPTQGVAAIVGEAWLCFLDKTSQTQGFTQGAGRLLITAPYQEATLVNFKLVFDLVEKWVLKASGERTMFKFASVWLLLLLPLPFILKSLLPPIRMRVESGLKAPFYSAISKLFNVYGKQPSSFNKQWMLYCVWFLLVMAAADPQWLGDPIELQRSGRELMLVIDISGSMQMPDLVWEGRQTTRLAVVKATAGKFIKERRGDRLGLILFGSRAYLQTPLTFDRNTVQAMLDDATIGLAGQETAIGDAIGLGIKHLIQRPKKSRVMILLTDGVNNSGVVDPVSAAKMAAKYGIKVYAIGLGAEKLIVPGLLGGRVINPSAGLDLVTLKKIAELTGGLYFRAKSTEDLKQVYKDLDLLEPILSDKTVYRPTKSLYPWLLFLALFWTVVSVVYGSSLFPRKWKLGMSESLFSKGSREGAKLKEVKN